MVLQISNLVLSRGLDVEIDIYQTTVGGERGKIRRLTRGTKRSPNLTYSHHRIGVRGETARKHSPEKQKG